MAITAESLDFVPHLDPPPSPTTRAAILSTLAAALPASSTTALHPSIPPLRPPPAAATASTLLASLPDPLHDPAAAPPTPLHAIDKARYESLDPPPAAATSNELRDAYARAAAAHSYLRWRAEHLGLLEEHGRDMWISGGVAVEAELGSLERELGAEKEERERVEGERRGVEEAAVGEVRGLEASWRRGVSGTVGALVAGEEAREGIVGERRARVERARMG